MSEYNASRVVSNSGKEKSIEAFFCMCFRHILVFKEVRSYFLSFRHIASKWLKESYRVLHTPYSVVQIQSFNRFSCSLFRKEKTCTHLRKQSFQRILYNFSTLVGNAEQTFSLSLVIFRKFNAHL